ncbi:5,10-methylenetetrahydrofolate reductase [Brachybacterium vulturis]|uniref:Methylenetetrahydrofolate reductase n=1 Tax=Brachybacterium vulturis TaxID=2017484 RepID=A0A291GJQ5_9MICO|nr:methylenetetrahydrofolate reductase [Brachybacterium vulturis]ATG50300.1 5,10-methylenetetrahydrofolate reductase [Brachybacterium vulturis]
MSVATTTLPELERTAPVRHRPALSYELFPARSDVSFERLRETITQLEATAPDYVSVTSRTGHGNLGRVLELTEHVLAETSLRPLVHLTSIGSTRAQLTTIIHALLDRGVRGLLALRGDQPDGHRLEDDEIPFARPLIELIRDIERERTAGLAGGRVSVGVAAYPHRHPESPTISHDTEVLVAKERAGADFAITQVFFDPDVYTRCLDRSHAAGVRLPLVPGLVPATNPRRLQRLAAMSGVEPPRELLHQLELAAEETERRRIGIRFTVDLARRVLDAGAPGLHLFTFNQHAEALDVLDHLDLDRWSTTSQGDAR